MSTIRTDKGDFIYVQFKDPSTGKWTTRKTDIPNTSKGKKEAERLNKKGLLSPIQTKNYFTLDMVLSQAEKYYFAENPQLAQGTMETRQYALRHLREVEGDKKLDKYNQKSFDNLIKYFDARKHGVNTRAIFTSELHSFFQWFVDKGYLGSNFTRILPRKIKQPRRIPEEILEKILVFLAQKENLSQFCFIYALAHIGCRKSDSYGS